MRMVGGKRKFGILGIALLSIVLFSIPLSTAFGSGFGVSPSPPLVEGDVSGVINDPSGDVITDLTSLSGDVTLTSNTSVVGPGQINVELRDFETGTVVLFSSTTTTGPLGLGSTVNSQFNFNSLPENEYLLVMSFGNDLIFYDLASSEYFIETIITYPPLVEGDVSGVINDPSGDVVTNLTTLSGDVTLTSNTSVVGPGQINVELRDLETGTIVLFSSTTTTDSLGLGSIVDSIFNFNSLPENGYRLVMSFGDDLVSFDLASSEYIIDLTPPDNPLTPLLDSDSGSSNTDNVTNVNPPTLSGTAEEDSTVEIFDGLPSLGTTQADGSGNWIFTTLEPLSEGDHTITVTATDAAGNTSGKSNARNIEIDTIAPSAPNPPDLNTNSDSGTNDIDNITSDTTPTLDGTAENGSTIEVFDDGVSIGNEQLGSRSTIWEFTTEPLSEGVHPITVTVTDAAGNTSLTSSSLDITIDTTSPTVDPFTPNITVISSSDTSTEFTITVQYDEEMDTNFTPGIIEFTPTIDSFGTLTFDGPASEWTTSDTFIARYTIFDVNQEQNTVGVSIDNYPNAVDLAGNLEGTSSTPIPPPDFLVVDTLEPVISLNTRTAFTANDWNNADVTVTFTCTDDGTGVNTAASTLEVVVSSEGAGQFATGTCIDNAGNSASLIESNINIDKTDPEISLLSRTAFSANDWNNSPVTVSYDPSDALSGIDEVASDYADDTLSGEGDDQSTSGTVFDMAGNTAIHTEEDIRIDLTSPTIEIASRTEANANGWNNEEVTVTYTVADDQSQIVNSGVDTALAIEYEDDVFSVETIFEGVSTSGTVFDMAGNSAFVTTPQGENIRIDLTAPVIDPLVPITERTEAVTQNAALTPVDYNDYIVTDPLSGIATSTCIDNDIDSIVSTTDGSFSKGITSVTCNATDIADNTNADTDFTIAIAEVIVSEICVTGPSSTLPQGVIDCTVVSPDGTGTVEVPALWGTLDLVTVRGTIYGYQTPTDATALTIDWGSNDPGTDSLTTQEILALTVDEDVGATFEFTHNYAGQGVAAGEYLDPEVIQVTMTGSSFTSNANAQVSVQKHDTEFLNNDQLTVFWADTVEKSGILIDSDTGLFVPDTGIVVTVDGTGMDVNADGIVDINDVPVGVSTNSVDGTFSITGPSPILVATGLTMNTTFAENEFYNSASIIPDDTFDNLIHQTAFQGISLMPDNEPWGASATKSGILVDTHLSVGIAGKTIDVGGDGSGSLTSTVETADGTGADVIGFFSSTGTTSMLTATDVEVILFYFGDDLYAPAPNNVDVYSTLIHGTSMSLEDIEGVTAGTKLSVIGTLTDDVTGETIAKKQIKYAVTQGEPFTIEDSITPGPLTISAKSIPGKTEFTVTDNNLELESGISMAFNNLPNLVYFTLEPKDSTVTVLVVGSDDSETPGTLSYSADAIPITHGAGIKRIDITETSNGFVPLSKIEERNGQDVSIISTVFPNGEHQSLQFGGNFDTVAVTPLVDELRKKITATFVGDRDYSSSDKESIEFDTTFQPATLQGSTSPASISSVTLPDTGVGIVGLPCLDQVGDGVNPDTIGDIDQDSICNEWEADYDTLSADAVQTTAGIPFSVGTSDFFYPLTGTKQTVKDLIVEIDAMPDHVPSDSVLNEVADAFSNYDVNMINDISNDDIPHLDLLNVWKDTDNVFGNDFNSLKSLYFGNTDEHVTMSGIQSNEFKNEKLIQVFDGDYTDDSGNGNSGTPIGNPTFVSGQIGQAISLNGVDERVKFPDNTFNGNDEGTVAAWVNPSTAHNSVIFGAADSNTLTGLWRLGTAVSGSEVQFVVQSRTPNNVVKTIDTFPINTWTHVALTGSGNVADPWKIYVNGIEVDVEATTGSNQARWWDSQLIGTGDLIYTAGAWERSTGTISYFNGEIDDLRVYDFALTEKQITNMYNIGSISNPVSIYNLDGDVSDDSNNNNDGVVVGKTTFVSGKIDDSFNFDGASRIEFTDNSFNSQSKGTVAAWVNPSTAHNSVIFGAADSNTSTGLWRLGTAVSGSEVQFVVQSRTPSNVVKTIDTFPINTWTHVALTGSGNVADPWKIYVNGIEVDVEATTGSNQARWWDSQLIGTGDLRYDIGAWERSTGTISYFNGEIDDLRIYDDILDADQIKKLTDTTPEKILSLVTVSGITLNTPANYTYKS